MACSRRSAAEWFAALRRNTMHTGRRARVYFAAVPALCCSNRRAGSVVMPVYSVPSAHRNRYTHHVRFGFGFARANGSAPVRKLTAHREGTR